MLSHRFLTLADIRHFIELTCDDGLLVDIITHENELAFQNGITLSLLVDEQIGQEPKKLVAALWGHFIHDWYFDEFCQQDEPWLMNASKVTFDQGRNPFVTFAEAPTVDGFSLLIVAHDLLPSPNGEPKVNLHEYLMRYFVFYHSGWKLNRIIAEPVGEEDRNNLILNGWKVVTDYVHKRHLEEKIPTLLTIDRETALAGHDAFMVRLFIYRARAVTLSLAEKELMRVARLGSYTDVDLAKELGITVDAIKKRWKSVYAKLSAALPNLLAQNQIGGRGPENRRKVIDYIREHPELLWP